MNVVTICKWGFSVLLKRHILHYSELSIDGNSVPPFYCLMKHSAQIKATDLNRFVGLTFFKLYNQQELKQYYSGAVFFLRSFCSNFIVLLASAEPFGSPDCRAMM